MKNTVFLLLIASAILSCKNEEKLVNQSKIQIIQTEKDFEKMLSEIGAAEAFSYFADDSAVILRRDSVIKGKEGIRNFYQKWKSNSSLKWTPDYVNVSKSGDLGYTYGKYTYSVTDSTGKKQESHGHFHTVWKKQSDGNWRFLWD